METDEEAGPNCSESTSMLKFINQQVIYLLIFLNPQSYYARQLLRKGAQMRFQFQFHNAGMTSLRQRLVIF